jgi:hypothetical protein
MFQMSSVTSRTQRRMVHLRMQTNRGVMNGFYPKKFFADVEHGDIAGSHSCGDLNRNRSVVHIPDGAQCLATFSHPAI